ncbi:DNA-N1-methyladenine dioxygenase [Halopseudomonas litoralis]|uniref:DNA-N1-methyladenine dioxygenase n=1 Tax=Halopseudomonas litoralis TaxID=797277 RepID=A0A1H1PLZ1_9GAMM|nr:DNA oxidative demethylase AlkB [Halopseudomonas litoralis]SDS12291.1 DNA-N1-methyladenine dioxygenase [Halopseudomonas litoralis]
MSTLDLFHEDQPGQRVAMGAQAFILPGFANPWLNQLLPALQAIQQQAPFRQMITKGGRRMSVQTTACGELGWVSSDHGYRYCPIDPTSGQAWPVIPSCLLELAQRAAAEAGFNHFHPDTCLINRYLPGARMGLHQDKDEKGFKAPIVSVSLGMSATFLFGGFKRSDRPARTILNHGDVVVWGGVDRMRFHGVMPVGDMPHPELGSQRINLTLRKAG